MVSSEDKTDISHLIKGSAPLPPIRSLTSPRQSCHPFNGGILSPPPIPPKHLPPSFPNPSKQTEYRLSKSNFLLKIPVPSQLAKLLLWSGKNKNPRKYTNKKSNACQYSWFIIIKSDSQKTDRLPYLPSQLRINRPEQQILDLWPMKHTMSNQPMDWNINTTAAIEW